MRGRDAGSADGRTGRREAVGNWGLGKARIGQCHCSPHAASAILTSRTRLLSNSEPEFSSREEEGISRVYPFSLDELSAFCSLCGKRASGKLANQR